MWSSIKRGAAPLASLALMAGVLTVSTVAVAPVTQAADDPQTGCDNVYDSAVVGRTPIQFMRMINEIPQTLRVDRTSAGSVNASGRVTPATVTSKTIPVWLGQRTPYLDGGNTRDHKEYNSGSAWWTDHWWDAGYTRHTIGCYTNIPFVVGPGDGDKAFQNTYDYEGKLYGRNDNWRGKGNWWAFPKNYSREGVAGFHSWTCRGAVDPLKTSSVYWKKVNQGSGFFGDNDRDRRNSDAGRAPACQDPQFQNLSVKSYLSQTYYGNLPDNVRTSNRCEASGGRGAASCWNEIYGGPWARTWRQETHVYAVALRAVLSSTAQIDIPQEYRLPGDPTTRRLSWVITQAETTGSWPSGSSGLESNKVPSDDSVTPFTVPGGVPGRASEYVIGSWGNVNKPEQRMTFRLTATTDGTWKWPVNDQGEELLRPSVDLTFKFTLNNFNYQGESCTGTSGGEGTWTKQQPCLFGLVPTLFQVTDNIQQNERRQPKLDDKGNPISTADFKYEAVQGGWSTSDLKVQQTRFDWGSAGGAYVGANARWNVNLSGTITNLQ